MALSGCQGTPAGLEPTATTTAVSSASPPQALTSPPASEGDGSTGAHNGTVDLSIPQASLFHFYILPDQGFVDGDADFWVNWTHEPGEPSTRDEVWAVWWGNETIHGPFWDSACKATVVYFTHGQARHVGAAFAQDGRNVSLSQEIPSMTGVTTSNQSSLDWMHVHPANFPCGRDAGLHVLDLQPFMRPINPIRLKGHWKNAQVLISYSGPAGDFAFTKAQCQTGSYVGVSASGFTPSASANCRLQLNFRGPAVFVYYPEAEIGGASVNGYGHVGVDGKAWYTRPDGTTVNLESGGIGFEFAEIPGAWTFGYDASASASSDMIEPSMLFGTAVA
ncbi:MAG: hypothetical protein V4510_03830 [bacterium]